MRDAELVQDRHGLASAVELKRLLVPYAGCALRARAVAVDPIASLFGKGTLMRA